MRYLKSRRVTEQENVNPSDNMQIIILDAINKKESSVKMMMEVAKKEPIYLESAKRLSQLCKTKVDSSNQILC